MLRGAGQDFSLAGMRVPRTGKRGSAILMDSCSWQPAGRQVRAEGKTMNTEAALHQQSFWKSAAYQQC
jgi:hypothetical protein